MLTKMQDESKFDLFYRRNSIASLYNDELENWKQEVLSKEETIEERKARIMKKAYALRDEREFTRNAHVQRAYERQWRDANDDSRTLNSDAMTKYMANERKQQMVDKLAPIGKSDLKTYLMTSYSPVMNDTKGASIV